MANQIFVVVKRTPEHDEEIAYREFEIDAIKEMNTRIIFDKENGYLIKTKKVFGLNSDKD